MEYRAAELAASTASGFAKNGAISIIINVEATMLHDVARIGPWMATNGLPSVVYTTHDITAPRMSRSPINEPLASASPRPNSNTTTPANAVTMPPIARNEARSCPRPRLSRYTPSGVSA